MVKLASNQAGLALIAYKSITAIRLAVIIMYLNHLLLWTFMATTRYFTEYLIMVQYETTLLRNDVCQRSVTKCLG